MTPRLLTLSQVADQLGISTRSVSRLVSTGLLVSVLVGTTRRIRSDDLEHFIGDLAPARAGAQS
jgi:excisionase family DNA binding protein